MYIPASVAFAQIVLENARTAGQSRRKHQCRLKAESRQDLSEFANSDHEVQHHAIELCVNKRFWRDLVFAAMASKASQNDSVDGWEDVDMTDADAMDAKPSTVQAERSKRSRSTYDCSSLDDASLTTLDCDDVRMQMATGEQR